MNPEPPRASHLVAVAAAIVLGVLWALPGLQGPVSFDGGYAYLPMAKKLLAEGFAYLHRPESLAAGIVAYAWPALLGANEARVRVANLMLYAAVIALAFAAVRAVHSNRAGIAAASLMAASPAIHPYMADVMTEPPFVFLIALWAAAVAAVARGRVVPGVVAGGVALALATFTRPAIMWFPVAVAAVFAWRAYRNAGVARRIDVGLASMHALAAALIGILVARNAVEFGYPAVATGAGNALFHGVNALVDGFDPTYYGLTYDEGAATRGGFHLAIAQDRLLSGTALEELRATPVPLILEMWARKAVAYVFFAPQDWNAMLLRGWRALLVVFALAAVTYRRRSPMVIALALFAGYLVAVHAPLFYLARYSATLDPALVLLAGIGLAEVFNSTTRLAAFAVASLLAVGLAVVLLADPGPGSPHPERSPYAEAWTHEGATFHATRATAIEFPVTGATRLNPSAQSIVTVRLALTSARHGRCGALRLRYKGLADKDYDPQRTVRVPVRADGRPHDIAIGAYAPLRLNQEGVLRMEFECSASATAEIGTIRILEPLRAPHYRDRYLERLAKDGMK